MKIWYAILYSILKITFNLFRPVKAIGRENIPAGAAVICGNHISIADPLYVVFALQMKNRPQVMAKKEIMEWPVIGFLLKKAGVYGVDRGNNDIGAVKRSLKLLKDGEKLLLFPEGTRVKEGEESAAKNGAAMFALRTGTPLLPVYISPKRRMFRRTLVVIGEAYMPTTPDGGKKASAEEYSAISDDLMKRIAALGEQYER